MLADNVQSWSVVWHLAMATAGAITALLARQMWQQRSESRFRTVWIAFGSIAFAQFVLAVLALGALTPPPLAHALDGACALLAGWGLVAPFLPLRQALAQLLAQRVWPLVAVLAPLLLSIPAWLSWLGSSTEPGWTLLAWGLLSALGTGLGALGLALRSTERRPVLVGVLSALSLSALVWGLGFEPLGRALWLAAFITLPVTITRQMMRELESAEQELQSFSQHALRQTQQLFTLLQSSTALISTTGVSDMLGAAVERIALGTGADVAVVALIGDDADQTLGVMATYPPRAEGYSSAFPLDSQPAIAQAVRDNQQAILDVPAGPDHPLSKLLDEGEIGPAMIQPMTSQDRTIGVIVVGNTHDKPLGEGAGRLLDAMGAQIATALENIRMYHHMNNQAKNLARLLTVREEEASQRAAILESIADGVVVTDKDDVIILANAAASNILGMSRSELIGKVSEKVFASIIPLPLSVFRTSDDASLLETVRMDFEISQRLVQTSLAPVQTASGELLGVVAVLRDVTRERQAELAKTEFIATISHELRTPLTAIKGYADLMNTGATGELSATQQQFVSKICSQAAHLIHLINAVIQYSELERGGQPGAAQAFDIGQTVDTVLESFQKRIEASGFTVTLKVEPGTPPAYAHPERTRQIIDELVNNALRYTPAPGHLVISLRPVYDGLAKQPAGVALAVSDTGVGIAPEDIERVFERFYRAGNPLQVEAGGLGLGLTVARALAIAQGGKLWADSPATEQPESGPVEGCPGATFTLHLPIEAGAVSLRPKKPSLLPCTP
ncbi:MAG: PAS domain S-box protein [Thermoflexales bacterium]|nr:PAS domain S-box protein [Thermoflexales bacterium]